MKIGLTYYISFLVLLFTIKVFSQEIQVPMDSDGKISYIDSVMNNKIVVFESYPGFIEARLFKLNDSTFSLEISYMVDELYNRHRTQMNRLEVDSFRLKVSQKLKDKISNTIDQDGRAELLWGLTLSGLGCYGPASIFLTRTEETSAVGIYMLTSAASFFIPYALTKNSPVSDGASRLSLWGASSGMGHGIMLYFYFGMDKTYDSKADEQNFWGLMAFTSIAEAYAGYRIAQDNNFSAGKSDMLINSSIAGTGALPGLLYIAGVEGHKAYYASTILGSLSGYLLGNYISNTQNYTRGDGICFTNSWILGALAPVSILLAGKSEDSKLYIGSAILGASVGMIVGNNIVKGKDFTTSQGVYMSLGSFGGAFVMGGVSLLFMGNHSDNYEIIPMMITIGAIGGFALTYSAFADDPKIQEKKSTMGLNVDFNLMALAPAFSKSRNINLINNYSYMNYYNPVLKISYKF